MDEKDRQFLDDVFSYHAPTAQKHDAYQRIRHAAKALATEIFLTVPPSPDRSAAVRKIREAVMTANAAIALDGRA